MTVTAAKAEVQTLQDQLNASGEGMTPEMLADRDATLANLASAQTSLDEAGAIMARYQ